MRSLLVIMVTLVLVGLASSCSTTRNFGKRQYTDGNFHDFHLLKNKTEKCDPAMEEAVVAEDSVKSRMDVAVDQVKESFSRPQTESMLSSSDILQRNYPMLADRMDSTIARQMQKDSIWNTDSLPEEIGTAMSTQAMLGLGTVGGLITIAAPESIWYFAIPMVAAPFSLLISLIAAAVAMSKINSGEIDKKYKRWMKLWAVCLLVNLVLGSLVLMHYVFL